MLQRARGGRWRAAVFLLQAACAKDGDARSARRAVDSCWPGGVRVSAPVEQMAVRAASSTEMLFCLYAVVAVFIRHTIGLPNVVRIGESNEPFIYSHRHHSLHFHLPSKCGEV